MEKATGYQERHRQRSGNRIMPALNALPLLIPRRGRVLAYSAKACLFIVFASAWQEASPVHKAISLGIIWWRHTVRG